MSNKEFNTKNYTVKLSNNDNDVMSIKDKFGNIKEIPVDEFDGMLGMLFETSEFESECEN